MKYRIEMQPLAGRHIVALKDVQTGDLVKVLAVNATSAEIIRLVRDGLDLPAIVEALHQKYGVPEEQLHADVEALLKKLE